MTAILTIPSNDPVKPNFKFGLDISLAPTEVDARLLLAGPGGGGGKFYGGGGSGGEVVKVPSKILQLDTTYTVVIPDGGLGADGAPSFRGQSPADSTVFDDVTAGPGSGGGGGGGPDTGYAAGAGNITGGGGSPTTAGVTPNGGVGTLTRGGYAYYDGLDSVAAGGGSSQLANGGDAPHTGLTGGDGADGVEDDIEGFSRRYGAGGGGGQKGNGAAGQGGDGGGGDGGLPNSGEDAEENSGSGGGGAGGNVGPTTGGRGAKGRVVVRYPGGPYFTGGTITTVGGDTVHVFTATEQLIPI